MVRLYGLTGVNSVIAFAVTQISAAFSACGCLVYVFFSFHGTAAPVLAMVFAATVFAAQYRAWAMLSQTLIGMNIGLPQRLGFLQRGRRIAAAALAPALGSGVAVYATTADVGHSAAAAATAFLIAVGLGSIALSSALLRQALEARIWRRPIVDIWERVLEEMKESGRATDQLIEFVERERNGPRGADNLALGTEARVQAGAVRQGGVGFNDVRGYVMPGLLTRPIHDPADFAFTKILRARYTQIKAEVETLYRSVDELEQYPFAKIERWRSIPLYKGGVRFDRYADLVPTLMDVIENHIPGATIREVVLSCLQSGGLIEPHFDNVLPLLTLHLPFDVPEGDLAGIRVGNEVVIWREGEPVIIDTSFEHEAWNHGATPRLNLLLDFWHPSAPPEMRDFFTLAYKKQMERHL
jgi:Aspartyl/Asparaginyl beta-hydroxylase